MVEGFKPIVLAIKLRQQQLCTCCSEPNSYLLPCETEWKIGSTPTEPLGRQTHNSQPSQGDHMAEQSILLWNPCVPGGEPRTFLKFLRLLSTKLSVPLDHSCLRLSCSLRDGQREDLKLTWVHHNGLFRSLRTVFFGLNPLPWSQKRRAVVELLSATASIVLFLFFFFFFFVQKEEKVKVKKKFFFGWKMIFRKSLGISGFLTDFPDFFRQRRHHRN